MKELKLNKLGDQALNSSIAVSVAPDGRLWRLIPTEYAMFVDSSMDYGKSYAKAVKINPADQAISAWPENPPVITVSRSGRIYVLYYTDEKQKTTAYFSYSTDNGQTFSKPVLVSDQAETARHYMARMLVDRNDKVSIFWHDTRSAQQQREFQAGKNALSLYYAETDKPASAEFPNRFISDGICSCCRTAIAFSPEEKPVILARLVFPGEIRDHGLIMKDAGGQWTKPRRVTFDDWKIDACPEHGPALAIDNRNRAHMTWFTLGDKNQGVFYAHTDDYGKTVSGPKALGNESRLPSHPDVAVAGARVALAWREFDGETTHIVIKQSNDRGTTWSEDKKILSSTADSSHPRLIGYDGRIFLSWTSADAGHHFIEI
ncbi:MAG: sialidase family protein [Gammaproteobacteria bacterium]